MMYFTLSWSDLCMCLDIGQPSMWSHCQRAYTLVNICLYIYMVLEMVSALDED